MHSFYAVIFVGFCLSMQASAFLGFGKGDQYTVSIQGAGGGIFAQQTLRLVATKPKGKADTITNPNICAYEDVRGRIVDRARELHPSSITPDDEKTTSYTFQIPYLEKDVRGVRFCLCYKPLGSLLKTEYCDKTKYHRIDPPKATTNVKTAPLPSRPAVQDAPLSPVVMDGGQNAIQDPRFSVSRTPGPVAESFEYPSAIPAAIAGTAAGAALGGVPYLRRASSLKDAPVSEDAEQAVTAADVAPGDIPVATTAKSAAALGGVYPLPRASSLNDVASSEDAEQSVTAADVNSGDILATSGAALGGVSPLRRASSLNDAPVSEDAEQTVTAAAKNDVAPGALESGSTSAQDSVAINANVQGQEVSASEHMPEEAAVATQDEEDYASEDEAVMKMPSNDPETDQLIISLLSNKPMAEVHAMISRAIANGKLLSSPPKFTLKISDDVADGLKSIDLPNWVELGQINEIELDHDEIVHGSFTQIKVEVDGKVQTLLLPIVPAGTFVKKAAAPEPRVPLSRSTSQRETVKDLRSAHSSGDFLDTASISGNDDSTEAVPASDSVDESIARSLSAPEVVNEATPGSDLASDVPEEATAGNEPAAETPAAARKLSSTMPIKQCPLNAHTEMDVFKALKTPTFLKKIKASLGYQGLKLDTLTSRDFSVKLSPKPRAELQKKRPSAKYGKAGDCERSHLVASGALSDKIDKVFGGRVEVLLGYIRDRKVVVSMISATYRED